MKRCPECRRDYTDETLKYCLDDGSLLLDGPASMDEPATAIISVPSSSAVGQFSESATRAQIHTAEAEPQRTFGDTTEKRSLLANRATKPLVAAGIAILLLIGGSLAYRYYFNPPDTGQIDSIAVLPFQNRSDDADTDYLSDGLAESLIFRLTQLPGLKVSPTSSVTRYKGKETDVAEIASELGVDAVMTGRLTKRGDNLNISVELVDTRNNKSLWGEQYERKISDLLSTQREIAATIAGKLQLRLTGNEAGIAKKYTSSNEAFQLYLKGRFHWAKRKKDDMLIAIDSFKQAIALDPNFALAYVGIAEAYNSMGKNPDIPPKEAIPLAKSAAIRALELDPMLAEGHSALADSLAIGDWNWAESERKFERAIEIDPNIAYIHAAYSGSFLTAAGRTDEAVAETARALELEPVSLVINAVHVTSLMNARRFDEALVQARKAYELDHDFPLARHWLGLSLSATGKYDEAVALGNSLPTDSPILPIGLLITGYAHARAGRRAEAEKVISQMHEAEKTHYVRPYYIACIWAALGEKGKAFAELERSFAEKDCYIPRMQVDPFLDPLRDDPRFADLLKRMGLHG